MLHEERILSKKQKKKKKKKHQPAYIGYLPPVYRSLVQLTSISIQEQMFTAFKVLRNETAERVAGSKLKLISLLRVQSRSGSEEEPPLRS
jgi:DNA topoisomerase VI subunit B